MKSHRRTGAGPASAEPPPRPGHALTERQRTELSLARRIAVWSKRHERCRNAGCRRNVRCMDLADCRVLRELPPMTDEERLDLGRRLKEAMKSVMEERQRQGVWPPAGDAPPRARRGKGR
jgi:hypothetical protein